MTTLKREIMLDEDDVGHGDEIETKIKKKREWGERFEREEQDRRGWLEPTGFEEVQEERCGLCEKAREEKMVLEEEVSLQRSRRLQ